MSEASLMADLRGAAWYAISHSIRAKAECDQRDINQWLGDKAAEAYSRSEEAYAIAKILKEEEQS